MAISVGDRVLFHAGRGKSTGRVVNIADGMATIATDAGKNVNRRLSRLAKTDIPAPAARPRPDDENNDGQTVVVETPADV